MLFVEREHELAQLNTLLDAVEQGQGGRCALIHGEAGIGKTSFVRHFAKAQQARVNLLWGGCEALFTPRPLGPIADMAERLPPGLAAQVQDGRTHSGLFVDLLAYLRDSAIPTLLVLEDAHWADEATLDFAKYLGRRIEPLPLLLVLTYRDDELAPDHLLRRVLGELPSGSTLRISLPPFSEQAVEHLAAVAGRSANGLFAITDGNPFFLTEVLRAEPGVVPASVRDATLTRLARLSPAARSVAELVSTAPGRIERAIIDMATSIAAGDAALDECINHGVLTIDQNWVSFRHELARRCVENAMSPVKLASSHARVFHLIDQLPDRDAQLSHLVHHAERAGMGAEVLRLAPLAAGKAINSSAHREAVALLALALRYADALAPVERAALLELRAQECMLANLAEPAIVAGLEALALRRAAGDALGEGTDLRRLARLYWFTGNLNQALEYARQAVAVLENLLPNRQLSLAYGTVSLLLLQSAQPDMAEQWAFRADTLARELDDTEAQCYALFNMASAQLRVRDDAESWEALQRSLSIAREEGFEEHAARGYMNMLTLKLVHHDFRHAILIGDEGIGYCEDHDLDVVRARLGLRRAFALMELGRWPAAELSLTRLDQDATLTAMERASRQFVHGLLRVRRGDAGASDYWLEVQSRTRKLPLELWFASTSEGCAEAAWLRGDFASVEQIARAELATALTLGESWRIGQLAAWLHRVEKLPAALSALSAPIAHPFRLEIAGQWRAAASAWEQQGCPYQQALALMGGDALALQEALPILDALGAVSAAKIARQRLRTLGVRGVRRGPNSHTQTDPDGLTRREREIYELVAQDLSNQVIARKLHRSERTVEHHVTALLAKLGANSRAQLIARAGRSREK